MVLSEKVVILAGGEGPLGRAVLRKFLREGARVVVGWNNPEEWEEAKKIVSGSHNEKCIDTKVDLTKEADVERLIQIAKDEFGGVDALLHMVGMFSAGPRIWEMDASLMSKLLETNLKSAFLCAKHGVRAMLEKGKGRFVVFPAKDVIMPKPGFGAYAVSKSGLVTLVQALREELKETKITANAVMFSVLDTPKTRMMPNPEPEKWVKPADVANFLAHLCCDDCDALNGSLLKLFAMV